MGWQDAPVVGQNSWQNAPVVGQDIQEPAMTPTHEYTDVYPQMQQVHEMFNNGQLSGRKLEVYNELMNRDALGPILAGNSISTITGKPVTAQQIEGGINPDLRIPESVGRPALEAGGMIAGGMVGTASPIPGGAVISGTLGYTAGKGVADIFYEKPRTFKEAALTTAEDIRTGAELEMTGQLIAPAYYGIKRGGKWAFNKLTEPMKQILSKKAGEKAAGEILVANTSAGDIYAKNIEEAKAIEKEIPGLKFTLGQKSADPKIIKLERTHLRRPGAGVE